MNLYLERIADEWRARAEELGEWAMRWLVNRTDVWGKYTGKTTGDFKAVTAPFKQERGKVKLEVSSLKKHFRLKSGRGLVGLHSTGADYTSRWAAIDIDRHDDQDLSVTPEATFAAANRWRQTLQTMGFDPVLMDSNGAGGFHLLILFEEPQDTRSVNAFLKRTTADFAQNLDMRPDLFPGSVEHGHYGNWLRLPGRHHTREHYTRVFNDEPWAEEPWLEGYDAIDRLLTIRPAPTALAETHGMVRRRQTVCLDFDGVIHAYTSPWQGEEIISDPPIHGTAKAIEKLRERYRVVVNSSRCRSEAGRRAIERWLTRHQIEVDEVCEHKPPAMVYVDDRGLRFEGDWNDVAAKIHEFRR